MPFASQSQEIDSIEFTFLPKSIRFGVDVLGMGKSFAKDNLTHYELTSDVMIHKYLINFDYGIEERSRSGDRETYSLKGNFYRVGVDINLMKLEDKASTIFFGFRYGKANFDNSLRYSSDSNVFGSTSDLRIANDLNARWYELTGGTKVKIWNQFWLGFTCRFKFSLKYDKSLLLTPHDIPGFGLADKKTYWGFNYFVFYQIPFSKKHKKSKEKTSSTPIAEPVN